MVQIKNRFGSFQTNPIEVAWWVPPFLFVKKVVFVKHPTEHLDIFDHGGGASLSTRVFHENTF